MLYKRAGAVLVAAALLQCGVSCEEKSDTPETTEQNMYVQTSQIMTEPPVFGEKDFDGASVTFIVYNEHISDYVDNYICADAESGDRISQAVSKRNNDTESKFNVNIETDSVYSPKNEAISRIQSGQCDFDVIYELGTELSTLALDGLLYDFNHLDGVDLDRSYWIPTAKDDLTVGGKSYIATNYITMNSIDYADMLFFNKTMYGELGYSDSLYDSVLTGTWNIDRLVNIAISATSDIDGDGEMMSNDRYGFWGSVDECITGFTKSAGVQNTVKNTDGSYSLDVYNEKIVNIYTAYADTLKSKDNFITYEDIWQEGPDLSAFSSRAEGGRFIGFGEGHVLFMPGTLRMAKEFKNMKDDYGILPNPLYDSQQRNYCHFINCDSPMFAIPKDGADNNIIGTVLEYMAYSSEQNLLPAYIEGIKKSETADNTDDEKMIGIIKNSLRYEWTELYNLQVTSIIKERMISTGSFKSVYNRLCSKAKAEINGCIDTLSFIGVE